jgi:hypothetical protein
MIFVMVVINTKNRCNSHQTNHLIQLNHSSDKLKQPTYTV